MSVQNSSEQSAQVEEWRDIPGHSGYQVSHLGRIRSCWRCANQHSRVRTDSWRIRKLGRVGNGYLAVSLGMGLNGKRQQKYVHRLVTLAFIGQCPDGLEVNHIDGVKTNNCATNLEYVTHAENERHSIRIGLRTMIEPLRGQDHPRAKLTQQQADAIRRIYQEEKIGMANLARRFGVTKVVVSNILKGFSYSHLAHVKPIARRSMNGIGNPMAKFTREQAQEMKAIRAKTGLSYVKIGKLFGVNGVTAWRIITNQSYREERA